MSIYIATYNRKHVLITSIKEILTLRNFDFDIWILDDCSSDGTVEELNKIQDRRLHIITNSMRIGIGKDGVMPNWLKLAEFCDGTFCFHLNDRDTIDKNKLIKLINFLKHNTDTMGGICNLLYGHKIYNSTEAFLKIPYEASHPTGIIFNVDAFRKIDNRAAFYTKEYSYIHPHDLILGRLCEMGKMFRFEKIWKLANSSSFQNNKSFLYKKGGVNNSWFSPTERIKEYALFLAAIRSSIFPDAIKQAKAYSIAKHYLFYCTINYAYFISDPGQTAHYGIIPQKLSLREIIKEKNNFVSSSYKLMKLNDFQIHKYEYKICMDLYLYNFYFGRLAWRILKNILKK